MTRIIPTTQGCFDAPVVTRTNSCGILGSFLGRPSLTLHLIAAHPELSQTDSYGSGLYRCKSWKRSASSTQPAMTLSCSSRTSAEASGTSSIASTLPAARSPSSRTASRATPTSLAVQAHHRLHTLSCDVAAVERPKGWIKSSTALWSIREKGYSKGDQLLGKKFSGGRIVRN
jgi:hypothetical protein